jgi:cbb3-type cytochrome oxidase maturation protein
MEVLMLTVFVSLVLAAGGVLFFAWNVRERAHEHIDQLSLLPLEDDIEANSNGVRKQTKETA